MCKRGVDSQKHPLGKIMITAKSGGKVVDMHVDLPSGTSEEVRPGFHIPNTILTYGQVYIEPGRKDRCFVIYEGRTLLVCLYPTIAGIPILSLNCELPKNITIKECISGKV
jgi:hypothetical protein